MRMSRIGPALVALAVAGALALSAQPAGAAPGGGSAAPTCQAAGYQVAYGTPVVKEGFDAVPAGWTVTNRTPSGGWTFADAGGRGNLTGGSGGFAVVDSDNLGRGNTQDTDLVTPVL